MGNETRDAGVNMGHRSIPEIQGQMWVLRSRGQVWALKTRGTGVGTENQRHRSGP